ncbi:ATP-binding cassette domain-containing protein [Paenarthrobacter ilicis]|uniref:ATP-binding cassette domain-containing protein n=1 Tax=Paenarthrobacter ilicis TaxID=43665 RepID=UPI0028D11E14|nr:ATP-binding cassette domain-containing protein [Paenarthrobacter ilicis]
MLQVSNLSLIYGRKPIVQSATFSIPSKGVFLILGENGAGKTTLLKGLAGLVRRKGDITWNNSPLTDQVAVAFDDNSIHERLTGLQNLSALLDIPPSQLGKHAVVKDFLPADVLSKKTSSYSLGQRKKLKLAAAFSAKQPCILLDEPLSGLDDVGRLAFRRALGSAAVSSCVVIAEHDRAFYGDLTSAAYLLRRGKVVRLHDQPESEA